MFVRRRLRHRLLLDLVDLSVHRHDATDDLLAREAELLVVRPEFELGGAAETVFDVDEDVADWAGDEDFRELLGLCMRFSEQSWKWVGSRNQTHAELRETMVGAGERDVAEVELLGGRGVHTDIAGSQFAVGEAVRRANALNVEATLPRCDAHVEFGGDGRYRALSDLAIFHKK